MGLSTPAFGLTGDQKLLWKIPPAMQRQGKPPTWPTKRKSPKRPRKCDPGLANLVVARALVMPCCSYWLFLELLSSTHLKSTGGEKAGASEEVGYGEGNQGLADLVVCCTFLRVSMIKMTYLYGMKRFAISDQIQGYNATLRDQLAEQAGKFKSFWWTMNYHQN